MPEDKVKYSYLEDLLDEAMEPGYDKPIDDVVSDLTNKYQLNANQAVELRKLASQRPGIKE